MKTLRCVLIATVAAGFLAACDNSSTTSNVNRTTASVIGGGYSATTTTYSANTSSYGTAGSTYSAWSSQQGAAYRSSSTWTSAGTALGDNSQVSLDWAGSYTGTPVCDGCAQVEYTLSLQSDNKYTLTYNDPATGDPVKVEGDFKWDETGNSIGASIDGYNYVYRVGEGNLIRQATDAPADAKLTAPMQYRKVN